MKVILILFLSDVGEDKTKGKEAGLCCSVDSFKAGQTLYTSFYWPLVSTLHFGFSYVINTQINLSWIFPWKKRSRPQQDTLSILTAPLRESPDPHTPGLYRLTSLPSTAAFSRSALQTAAMAASTSVLSVTLWGLLRCCLTWMFEVSSNRLPSGYCNYCTTNNQEAVLIQFVLIFSPFVPLTSPLTLCSRLHVPSNSIRLRTFAGYRHHHCPLLHLQMYMGVIRLQTVCKYIMFVFHSVGSFTHAC